jgi:hypothetical protein
MANAKYTITGNMNDVLEKIRDFLTDNGWTILNNCTPDTAPNATGAPDGGEILAVKMDDCIAVMRSAMGFAIFPNQTNHNTTAAAAGAYGIGLTGCTAYTANPPSGYWYDQTNPPLNTTSREVIGVGVVSCQGVSGTYELFCNFTTQPAISAIFTIKEVINNQYTDKKDVAVYQHLAFGLLQKAGNWTGGMFISGSRSSYKMFVQQTTVPDNIDTDSNEMFAMSANPSFLVQGEVDSAPLLEKPILWWSAGPEKGEMSTGKILASTLTNHEYLTSVPKVPHYGYIQSQNPTDYGRNVNTLNCISVNLPIALFVQRDPNLLMNFSFIGYIPNAYAISMRCLAPEKMYEINYPKSGNLHQVFPHIIKYGKRGYDGISILQENT